MLLWFESITNLLSDFNSMFTVQITGRDFPKRVLFCISLNPSVRVVMIHLLLEECIHDKPLYEIV